MKRREFLGYSALVGFGGSVAWAQPGSAPAAKKALTEKDILREGQPTTIANYCENPEKQPNKFCPSWPTSKGLCETCTFYDQPTEGDYKGGKYAKCKLLADPTKAQYVARKAFCATYVKKA